MNLYSAYEYLAYIVPGGTFVAVALVVFQGWPTTEPGTAGIVVLLGLAFLLGHVVATVAAWLQSSFWGEWPGRRANPLWGLFGLGGPYSEAERAEIEREMREYFRLDLPLQRLYELAYTELQQTSLEGRLVSLNSEIGFSRNAATAMFGGAVLCLLGRSLNSAQSQPLWLLPALIVGGLLFVARYRRFWRQFGDNVVRGFRSKHLPKHGL